METSNGTPGEKSPGHEALNPVVARSIINYFQMADDLSPGSFELENPGNPIRFLLQDKDVTEIQKTDFLRAISATESRDGNYIRRHFFKDITSDQSPIALNAGQKAENMNTIMNTPELKAILERVYFPHSTADPDPSTIDSYWRDYTKWFGGKLYQDLNQAKSNYDAFLKLYFGEQVMDYAKQFYILQKLALKKFGPPKFPMGGKNMFENPEENYFEFKANSSGRTSTPPFGKEKFKKTWDENDEEILRQKKTGNDNAYTPPGAGSKRHHTPPPPPPPRQETRPPAINPADPKGFYRTLGLDPLSIRTLPANQLKIALRNAYRKAAKEAHTDTGGGNRDVMVRVNLAYEFLEKPENRATYGI